MFCSALPASAVAAATAKRACKDWETVEKPLILATRAASNLQIAQFLTVSSASSAAAV